MINFNKQDEGVKVMVDWVTVGIVLAMSLVIIAVIYAIASFLVGQYVKLMKLVLYGTLAVAAVIILLAVALAFLLFLR